MSGEGLGRIPDEQCHDGDSRRWGPAIALDPAPEPEGELVRADFRLASVGPDALLTRSWRRSSAPLAGVTSEEPDRACAIAAWQFPVPSSGGSGA